MTLVLKPPPSQEGWFHDLGLETTCQYGWFQDLGLETPPPPQAKRVGFLTLNRGFKQVLKPSILAGGFKTRVMKPLILEGCFKTMVMKPTLLAGV